MNGHSRSVLKRLTDKAALVVALSWSQVPAVSAQAPVSSTRSSVSASELFGKRECPRAFVYSMFESYCLILQRSPAMDITAFHITPCSEALQEDTEAVKEPQLSPDEFRHLLATVDSVVPIGDLVRIGDIGAVTNLQLHLVDVYENAVVERVISEEATASTIDDAGSLAVRSATVFPMRTIFGRLNECRHYQYDDPAGRLFRVEIEGAWYWHLAAQDEDLQKAIGQLAFMKVAGPIE
jgi:hypothetical protein